MKLATNITFSLESLFELCRNNKVEKLYFFGSVCTDNFNKDSDIDLIVELQQIPPLEKGEMLLKLWNEFEIFFKRKVDLLTNKPIKNPYFRKNIEQTKQLIYERKSE